MKPMIYLVISFLLLAVLLLCGCNDGDDPSGLIGEESNFYGIWLEKDGAGFGIGDTYKLDPDKNCEIYWSHGGAIHHYGTWDRILHENGFDYLFKISLGEKDTLYYFDFFDNYKTLRLKEQNSDSYKYLVKQ